MKVGQGKIKKGYSHPQNLVKSERQFIPGIPKITRLNSYEQESQTKSRSHIEDVESEELREDFSFPDDISADSGLKDYFMNIQTSSVCFEKTRFPLGNSTPHSSAICCPTCKQTVGKPKLGSIKEKLEKLTEMIQECMLENEALKDYIHHYLQIQFKQVSKLLASQSASSLQNLFKVIEDQASSQKKEKGLNIKKQQSCKQILINQININFQTTKQTTKECSPSKSDAMNKLHQQNTETKLINLKKKIKSLKSELAVLTNE